MIKALVHIVLAYAFIVTPVSAQAAPGADSQDPTEWRTPVAPFHIVGNVYYVGTVGLAAYLIKAPQGAILLDGTLADNATMIEHNIEALGVPLSMVKLLLSDHAHDDHVGALAQIKRDTGARLAAGDGDQWALEHGTPPGQVNYTPRGFPPVKVDRAVRDGDTVRIGPIVMTAHLTAGHTPGCTSWSMSTRENGRSVHVIFLCSLTVAGNVLLGNTAYPGIVDAYRRTFSKLARMKTDVVLPSHPEKADVLEREARRHPGRSNPFIDSSALSAIVSEARDEFEEQLKNARHP